jgi:hypothetical protein
MLRDLYILNNNTVPCHGVSDLCDTMQSDYSGRFGGPNGRGISQRAVST